MIEEYSDVFELLIVEATVDGNKVRIMSGYGPQECWKLEDRLPFFQTLEEPRLVWTLTASLDRILFQNICISNHQMEAYCQES